MGSWLETLAVGLPGSFMVVAVGEASLGKTHIKRTLRQGSAANSRISTRVNAEVTV